MMVEKVKQKFSPTCNKISLESATKTLAFVDMFFGLVGIAWFIFMQAKYGIISLEAFEPTNDMESITVSLATQNGTRGHEQAHTNLYGDRKIVSLTLSGFYIGYFYTGVNLTIFIVLLIGAFKRNPSLCMLWFNVRCAVLIFKIVILFIYIIGGVTFYPIQIPFILSMIIHLYGLWIVNCYVDQLRLQQLTGACCKARASEEDPPSPQEGNGSHKGITAEDQFKSSSQSDGLGVNEDELWAGIEILQRKRLSSTPVPIPTSAPAELKLNNESQFVI